MATNATHGPLNGFHSLLTNRADVTQWVAIDLGTRQSIDAVRLFPARPYDYPDTPGFLFPMRFRIELSDRDGASEARVVVDETKTDVANPGTNAPIYRFPPSSARFVRLQVSRLRERDENSHAFALAEMEILRGSDNVARNRKVMALNSIETGPWAKANLTDGITLSVPPSTVPPALPVTMVRKEFRCPSAVAKATAYVTSKGLYELRLNGQRVGDRLLAPEWTSYRRRTQVQTYDVTKLLQQGVNAVGVMVAEGWYAGRLMAMPRFP